MLRPLYFSLTKHCNKNKMDQEPRGSSADRKVVVAGRDDPWLLAPGRTRAQRRREGDLFIILISPELHTVNKRSLFSASDRLVLAGTKATGPAEHIEKQ